MFLQSGHVLIFLDRGVERQLSDNIFDGRQGPPKGFLIS